MFYILKDGREPFLNFLRNLTPQAIFLALAALAGIKLEMWTCCHPENTKQTIVFFGFLGVWFLSFWANSSLFFEKYLVSVETINEESKRLISEEKLPFFKHFWALIKFAKRTQPQIIVEAFIAFFVIEFGLAATIYISVMTATNYFNLFHR